MTTKSKNPVSQSPQTADSPGLLISLYRSMLLSRAFDDEEIRLKKMSKAFFSISAAGHEAASLACAAVLRPGHDWLLPYYRDRPLCLHLGFSAYEQFLASVGSPDDPASGGRQMTSHYGHTRYNMPSQSSPTGTQFNHAVGIAESLRYQQHRGLAPKAGPPQVVYASSGEGATSQGEFWEAVNVAANRCLPVIFCIQDNEYAISVPREVATAGGDIGRCMSGVPGLKVISADGTRLAAALEGAREAANHARSAKGPVLLHFHCTRPYSHSLSDDHKAYRTAEELEAEDARDCLRLAREDLLEAGILTPEEADQMAAQAMAQVREASAKAMKARLPKREEVESHLFAPLPPKPRAIPRPDPGAEPLTVAQALNRALHEELANDERVVVFGEDVADVAREEALAVCKGKGGVFKITHGLQGRHGSDRVFSTLLSENSIIGRAVGMALSGLRPVAEIQFVDFLWYGYMHVRAEMASMRWRSAGHWTVPMVLRAPCGGYLRGGGVYHSQSAETLFLACPGLRVAYPSNAQDAYGLLKMAVRMDDPVIFLEHKHLYYQGYARSPLPKEEFLLPFGKAAIVRKGSDATIITWGALVQKSLEAAERLQKRRGIETEVIDLRTLQPLDMETVYASVRRTGRLLVAYEEPRTGGFGAELASRVADECFEWLDAPIARVAARDTWVAYAPVLEAAALPQVEDVEAALDKLVTY